MNQANYYEVTTAPTGTVITLEEAKSFAKIDTDADDNNITRMINSVTEACENITNRTLRETGFRGEFASLDVSRYERYPFLDVLRSPLSSVSSVQIWDGTNYTDEPYLLQKKQGYSRILFNQYGRSTSRSFTYQDDVAYPIRVDFVAGYTADNIPDLLKHSLLEHVLFLYENRGDVVPDGKVYIPVEVSAAYRQFKVIGRF